MHYKFTFKIIYRIGVPQLSRKGVPQWNNSVKEMSFKTLCPDHFFPDIIICMFLENL